MGVSCKAVIFLFLLLASALIGLLFIVPLSLVIPISLPLFRMGTDFLGEMWFRFETLLIGTIFSLIGMLQKKKKTSSI
jgi:hypothetical protein